jgi:uncharacterized membrane protein
MQGTILGFSLAGLLFAGYLGGHKLFSGTCAFNESCPIFLGYPACYFGFAMYLILTIASVALIRSQGTSRGALRTLIGVSLFGVWFAGRFTLAELPVFFERGFSAYLFGLPTCALGLIFYTLIFILSVILCMRSRRTTTVPAIHAELQ